MSAGDRGENWADSQFAADAGLILGLDMGPADPYPADRPGGLPWAAASALGRSSLDLATRCVRAVSGWQDHVLSLVQAQSVTKRSIARVISFDNDSLSTVLVIGLLGHDAGDTPAAGGVSAVPQHLLTSLFGAGPLRDISAKARDDLHERIRLLFDEEMLRFAVVVDAAGELDEAAAEQLRRGCCRA